jgi:hypothetical protein
MYFRRTAIGWTPGGDVHVIALNELGHAEWFDKHTMTTGGFRADLANVKGEQAQLAVMVLFHMLVVRDKVDPMKVHNAFMDIEEYRDVIVADALPKDVERWATPSRKRMPLNRRHGVSPKRTTADLLHYWMAQGKMARDRNATP